MTIDDIKNPGDTLKGVHVGINHPLRGAERLPYSVSVCVCVYMHACLRDVWGVAKGWKVDKHYINSVVPDEG